MMKILVAFFLLLFMSMSFSADEDWIIQTSKGKVSSTDANLIVSKVYEKSIHHDVDPFLVFSIMQKESGYQKHVKNPDGSYGLMQIQAKVHRKKLAGRNPNDIDANLDVGIHVYKECQARWRTVEKALNCYNGRVFNNPFASKVLNIMRKMKQAN